jgi:hypothetical protein
MVTIAANYLTADSSFPIAPPTAFVIAGMLLFAAIPHSVLSQAVFEGLEIMHMVILKC